METLTINAVPMAQILPVLALLEREKTDTTAGAMAASDMVNPRTQGYRVDLDGVPVLVYALQYQDTTKKRICWVLAAAGAASGHDLTEEVLPLIEQQARRDGAQQMALTTRRRGLAKKIQAFGFKESGTTYRKNLQ